MPSWAHTRLRSSTEPIASDDERLVSELQAKE